MKKMLIVLMLLACKGVDPYIASEEAGDETGRLFLTAVDLWKQARADGLVSELQYEKWKEFGHRFQQLYPVAFDLWDTAVKQQKQPAVDQMKAIISQLAAELTTFMTEVTQAKKEK